MDSITFDLLTNKLKNAPQSVLERVMAYVDSLMTEPNSISKTYSLTKEQQEILDNQINSDKSTYTKAETLYSDLKKKYEL
ncbi:hypothetical protein B6A10_12765 [Flavobacterium sp. L1I52]|uniref:Addiction module component n=1 Tax=Flavobacterium pokkalii TaxID=1940408 RepID=A0ABR7UUV9_9FLAO|nr:hypothetical protein [Flavobacterium pokkalii]MBD0726048.1 hypothetical protein [Flavobacterium pokkalii]